MSNTTARILRSSSVLLSAVLVLLGLVPPSAAMAATSPGVGDGYGPEATERSAPDPLVQPTAFSSKRPDPSATAEVLEVATRTGRASVIVGLRVDFTPEGLLTAADAKAQRSRITSGQNGLLTRLASETKVRKFVSIPFVAMSLTAADARKASTDAQVASLRLDAADEPTLAETTEIVGVPHAASLGKAGAGQTVAVLDTGVDTSHPFLAGRIAGEACFSSRCPNGSTTQIGAGAGVPCTFAKCSHGTHVAGITAGRGSVVTGVAPLARILAVQVFSSSTSCTGASPCAAARVSDQIAGLEHVFGKSTEMQISAVNMSLGGGENPGACDDEQSERKAIIDNLRSVGIATVISSGNNGFEQAVSAPACISTAIAVGNTTKTDTVFDSSNSGPQLALLAPGTGVWSSVPTPNSDCGATVGIDGGGFCSKSGTSMAAPHVAGARVVVKGVRPNWSVAAVLGLLQRNGTPITDARNGRVTSRLDLASALNCVGDVWVLDAKAYEHDGVMSFPVRITESHCRRPLTFNRPTVRTQASLATSAQAGTDYTTTSRTFASAGTLDVPLVRDTLRERTEYLLAAATGEGLVFGDSVGLGTLLNG